MVSPVSLVVKASLHRLVDDTHAGRVGRRVDAAVLIHRRDHGRMAAGREQAVPVFLRLADDVGLRHGELSLCGVRLR